MDWVRVDANTPLHPKVGRLARRLGVGRVQAFGHVLSLWCWSIQHAAHGQLGDLDAEEIAEAGQWDGDPSAFVAGLQASGWLDEDKALHEWEMYQGKSARVNLMAQLRQDRKRKRDASVTQAYSERDTSVTRSVEDGLDGLDVEMQVAFPPEPLPAGVPFLSIPLKNGAHHTVTEQDVAEYEVAYPHIDVRDTLRRIRQWNLDRPAQRKMPSGARKHISAWLARDEKERAPQRRTERLEAIPDPEADRDPFREASEQVCRFAVPNLERSIDRLVAEGNPVAVEQMRTSLESARRRLGELERTTV